MLFKMHLNDFKVISLEEFKMHFLMKKVQKNEMTFLMKKNDIFRASLQQIREFGSI